MTLEATETECAAVAVAPRVSLADIEAAIAEKHFRTGSEFISALGNHYVGKGHPTEVLTICLLVMNNGFTIIGKSAPASPENFNKDLGAKLAYEDAIRQLWPLMGFALRDRLSKS